MEDENMNTKKECTIVRPEAKFMIGFFAGICASLFPRLIVALNVAMDESDNILNVQIFYTSYVIYATIFSILVGIVVMILEWNVRCKPGKTFAMALSVPALIAGGFNTNNAFDVYKDERASLLVEESIQTNDPIPINPNPVKKITPLAKLDDQESDNTLFSFLIPSIAEAYAGDSFSGRSKFLAFRIKQQLYVVVLDRANSSQEAINRASELRPHIRNAQAVEIGASEYFIIVSGERLPRAEALIRADQLRRQFSHLGLNIELLQLE